MTLTCVSIFCWCVTTGGEQKQLYSGWSLRALATLEQFGRVFGGDSLYPGHCTVKAVQFELLLNWSICAPPVHLSQLKSINCTHKDLLTLCVPKIWSQLIVQQSTIVRDCCTIGLAAGRFLLSASKRLHVGRGGGNHKKGLTSLPNTFKERGEGLWTSGQSRTH